MARSGRDPSQFARDLLAHLRHLLVTQTTGEVPTSFVVTATDTARLQAQAATVGPATLVRTIDELATALTAVREGDDARMAVEIALLKAARPDLDPSTEGLLRRIERLEGQLPGAEPTPEDDPPTTDAAEPEPVESSEPEAAEREEVPSGEDVPEAETVPPPEEAPSAPAADSDMDLEGLQRVWPAILDQLAKNAPALAAFFEEARPVGFDAAGGVVEISFPAGATFNKRKAEVPEQRERVAESLKTVTGQDLKPAYVLLEGDAPAPEEPAAGELEGVDEEELLERLKNEFDAEEVS
jgi:DNA polymerase-3 subunit gamma/tau